MVLSLYKVEQANRLLQTPAWRVARAKNPLHPEDDAAFLSLTGVCFQIYKIITHRLSHRIGVAVTSSPCGVINRLAVRVKQLPPPALRCHRSESVETHRQCFRLVQRRTIVKLDTMRLTHSRFMMTW